MRTGKASRTAGHNALFRALEARRPRAARVADDPLAVRFLGPQFRVVAALGRVDVVRKLLMWVIDERWPCVRAGVVIRTRLIDETVAGLLGEVEQVLILGAGFDTRAWRLAGMGAMPVFEVDHPATQSAKRRALSPVTLSALRRALSPVTQSALRRALSPVTQSALRRALSPVTQSAKRRALSPVTLSAKRRALSPVTLSAKRRALSPVTLSAKRRALSGLGPAPGNVTFVPVVFGQDDPAPALAAHGFKMDSRTLVVWEGTTNYLDGETVAGTFAFLAGALRSRSPVVFTYVDGRMLDGSAAFAGASTTLDAVQRVGEPFTFGLNPAEVPEYLSDRRFALEWDMAVSEAAAGFYSAGQVPLAPAYYRVALARRM